MTSLISTNTLKSPDWHDIFDYQDGDLIWKVKPSQRVSVGDKVSSYSRGNGYIHVQYRGFRTGVHRVVWEMHFGKIPKGMYIDHINHKRDDNRIENLRLVSCGENNRNRTRHLIGSSKCLGVTYFKSGNSWRARITHDGNVLSLGLFDDIFEAYCARKSAEYRLGFHENHGKSN